MVKGVCVMVKEVCARRRASLPRATWVPSRWYRLSFPSFISFVLGHALRRFWPSPAALADDFVSDLIQHFPFFLSERKLVGDLKVPCMYIDWHIVWGLCRRQCREMIQHLSGRTAYKNWLKRRGAWAFLALLSSMFFMWLCASQCWITCFLSLTPLHHAISRRHVANHVSLHCALGDRLSRSAQCSPQHADKRHMMLPAAHDVTQKTHDVTWKTHDVACSTTGAIERA